MVIPKGVKGTIVEIVGDRCLVQFDDEHRTRIWLSKEEMSTKTKKISDDDYDSEKLN